MARVAIYREQLRAEALRLSTPGRTEIAEKILNRFDATVPNRTGEFQRGASVLVEGSRVYVEDDDPEAFWKEYGTSQRRALATLTSAAREFGRYRGFQPRRGGSSSRSNLVSYTTRSGTVRMVTRAQRDYFNRGRA